MSNIVYENVVLESKLTDLLNTKMATRNFMKIDDSLAQTAGMIKTINVYSYTGAVETLVKGAINTVRGAISFTPVSYEVEVGQQVFDYFDESLMQDPTILDMLMEGASTKMVNDMNTKFFAELAKATLSETYVKGGAISYDVIVDAISRMTLEDENGLFIVIGTDLKADIRKDADFKSKQQGQIVSDGQIGTVAGIPVVVSKLVPAKASYVADKNAVTLFTKKDSEIEQDRDKEARSNTVILRKVNLVALTDTTRVVKITEALV